MNSAQWEQEVADAWAASETVDATTFRAVIDRLAELQPTPGGAGTFERASALDSTGRPDLAIPLYREALRLGLTGQRRRRATIQLASSLRSVGSPGEAVSLLTTEREATADSLDDAVVGFLALALADVGREREALSLTLVALAGHLPRYQRSLANYAADLTGPDPSL